MKDADDIYDYPTELTSSDECHLQQSSSTATVALMNLNTQRAVVTLSPPETATVHRMAAQMAPAGTEPVGPVEVVRRALILLDLRLSLSDNEELVVRNKNNGQCDRLRFKWEMSNS